ncbi:MULTISPECIES: polysaccharide deacetylase family protein [unclassified Nocardiopsis]|uniref:polysaccharide deacetylase family protein n=1 Tax=unclassified Nocardiopsis TaxID=2649073 RepID=UPI0033DF8A62
MAPDHPLLTVATAVVVVLGLVLSVSGPRGPLEDSALADDTGDHSSEGGDGPPATGEPDQLTTVSPDAVPGTEEVTLAHDGRADVTVTYPAVPHAAPLTDFLDRTLTTQVRAFEAANPGARSFVGEWGLTAAEDRVLGVRLTTAETDSEETREGHSTYWYETDTGAVHGSSELIAGQTELAELNERVREAVAGTDAVPSSLHPISALYDSVGFNPDGDLVVEFDSGQVAPASAGRVHAVIPRDEAEPLLSEFGLRARAAATTGVRAFTIDRAPEADKDGSAPTAPGVLAPRDDTVDCADPDTTCVALTYDDGPGGRTPELLDALAAHDARATFFVTGLPVTEHPWVVRRAYAEGHEIANHTLDHPNLTELSAGAARENLEATQALVYRETGYTMDLMRPPYGATNAKVADVTRELGLAQILWSVDTNDWRDRKASVVRKRVLDGASDGAIILMHDIHPTTIDASIDAIRLLDERGFTMVTVSQLLGTTEPGREYVDGTPDEEERETADGSA